MENISRINRRGRNMWKVVTSESDIKVYCDTYLSSLYVNDILQDMFIHGVAGDQVILDRAFVGYEHALETKNGIYKICIRKGPRKCMWVKGKTKMHVCQVAYFMDMYYWNESESERRIQDETSSQPASNLTPYSYKDINTTKEQALKKKIIKKIQKALADAISSKDFADMIENSI